MRRRQGRRWRKVAPSPIAGTSQPERTAAPAPPPRDRPRQRCLTTLPAAPDAPRPRRPSVRRGRARAEGRCRRLRRARRPRSWLGLALTRHELPPWREAVRREGRGQLAVAEPFGASAISRHEPLNASQTLEKGMSRVRFSTVPTLSRSSPKAARRSASRSCRRAAVRSRRLVALEGPLEGQDYGGWRSEGIGRSRP